MTPETASYLLFTCIFVALFTGDIIMHRRYPNATLRQNSIWAAVCIITALLFGLWVQVLGGTQKTLEYYTGYLVELALSVDNLFVFVLIFSFFSVPKAAQHRVLTWGIIGAIIMRAIFIYAGAYVIEAFHWVVYVLGAVLVLSSIKILRGDLKEHLKPDQTWVYKLFHRYVPSTPDYVGDRFFILRDGVLYATPLFFVLIVIETTDLVFAVDSIPAIFGITRDPLIVLTSNIFAVLGLRSIYHLISEAFHELRFLNTALAIVLCSIGLEMILVDFIDIPITWSLLFVVSVVAAGITCSLIWPTRKS